MKGMARPERLIAYRRGQDTLLQWEAAEGAAGYYVYARENLTPDGDYSGLSYNRINRDPVRETQFCDCARNVTYRVSAVDGAGEESAMSDMVYAVCHRGLEILAVRYFSGGEILTALPDRTVEVVVTAINSLDQVQSANVLIEWDGRRQIFLLAIPPDGLLHAYSCQIGEVAGGSVEAMVLGEDGRELSCRSRFRPGGVKLFDTLFEKGLLICEPYTAVLYDQGDGEVSGRALLDGQPFSHFHMQFCMEGKRDTERPFCMYLGKLQIRIGKDPVGNDPGETAGGKCGIGIWEGDHCLGTAAADRRQQMTFHIYAGEDTLRIFAEEEHMPVLAVPTGDACGELRLDAGDYTVEGLRVISQKPSFAGKIPLGKGADEPVWNIACWHSRYNWIRDGVCDEVQRFPDGSILVENPGRSFFLAPEGREVRLEARGSVEYERTRRREEGWTHLLLEVLWDRQPCGRLRIAGLQELWMTLDICLLMCENRTKGYHDDIHAGQFVTFFNISGIRGEAMWLGLCNFDNRFPEDGHREELTYQMDAGTNTFIIAPPQGQLIQGHIADGQWHSMSIDLKPVIRMVYEKGKEIGAFQESSFGDLKLNSMNLGFEIPGSFDMAVKLSNLQLTAVLEG